MLLISRFTRQNSEKLQGGSNNNQVLFRFGGQPVSVLVGLSPPLFPSSSIIVKTRFGSKASFADFRTLSDTLTKKKQLAYIFICLWKKKQNKEGEEEGGLVEKHEKMRPLLSPALTTLTSGPVTDNTQLG